MQTLGKNMLRSAVLLGIFAILATALVAFLYDNTHQRIAENKRLFTLKKLHELIPPDIHDNVLDTDKITVRDALLSRKNPVPVYRARKDGQTVAVIIQAVAPDGYSGRITLLVAINRDGSVAGVRVTEHRETPGLGDAIETKKSDWIHLFTDKTLTEADHHWRVQRDGGAIDQITSATITSRAVVSAVNNALRYFEQNSAFLLDES